MTRRAAWVPIRRNFDADGKHQRNWKYIEDYLEGANVGSAQIENDAVGQEELADGAVTDAAVTDVSMSKVTQGTMYPDITLVGSISPAQTGQRPYFDAVGIHAVDASGNILLEVPTAGGDIYIKASAELLGTVVTGKLTIKDEGSAEGHVIEPGAKITLAGASTGAGVGDPATKPGLTQVWETLTLGTVTSRAGLFYDSAATSFWTAKGNTIYEHDSTTGALERSATINSTSNIFGVVRVGTRVYVFYRDFGGDKVLKTLSQSNLSFIDQVNVESKAGTPMYGSILGIGDDGSNIILVSVTMPDLGATLQFHKFTRADQPAFVSTTTTSGAGNPSVYGASANLGGPAVDSGWWVSVGEDGVVYKWNTSGVYQGNNEFPTFGAGTPRGVAHDGTQFWTMMSDARIAKHTGWTWTTESAKYWVAYTWVDDNGAASVGSRPLGAGDFETKKSPTNSITLVRRGRLRVTVPTFPSSVTHAGLYIDRNASEPTLDYVADTSSVTAERTSFTAGGASPPATNTFTGSGGSNAQFQSADGSPLLRGNGYPRLRLFSGTPTANQPVSNDVDEVCDFVNATIDTDTGDVTVDTANDRVRFLIAGEWMISAQCQWASGTTAASYRELHGEYSAAGSVWTDLTTSGFLSRHIATTAGYSLTNTFTGQLTVDLNGYFRLVVHHDLGVSLNLNNWSLNLLYLGPS